MWIIEVPSEGDLTNDNYHIVHHPESSYCDDFGNEPRFMDALDVKLRKELIVDCIQRLATELKFLNDHQDTDLYDFAGQYLRYDHSESVDEFFYNKLSGCRSWSDGHRMPDPGPCGPDALGS